MAKYDKNQVVLNPKRTCLLLIDIQERILKVMRKHEQLLENVLKLIQGIKILDVPIYFTEQYPKGLGETAGKLKKELNGSAIQKLTFSCHGAEDLFERFSQNKLDQIIVCGIEAHVCVQQTVLDLLANNFQVTLPINAISSRYKIDYKTAINRMEKHGAEITTVESVLFELMQTCTIPEFKQISALIK